MSKPVTIDGIRMWRTNDMFIAAFLQTKGHNIEKIIKDKRKCTFFFKDTNERNKDVKDYHNNTTVGVIDFKSALQNIKQMMRDSSTLTYQQWSNYEDVSGKN